MIFPKTLICKLPSCDIKGADNGRIARLLGLAAVFLGLIGCGGTGQDSGTVSTFDQQFSGTVIDGYLARTTVFLDTNNDRTQNSWEPFAFTDDQGYFSFNPVTNTNYCAEDVSPELAQYCLRTNIEYTNVVLRVDDGYDAITGERFEGQMSRRISDFGSDNVTGNIISPLTSLVTDVTGAADQERVLSSLGLSRDALNVDYLNVSGGGEVDADILNAAIKVHKVTTVLADRITDTYTEIGDNLGTPNDSTGFIYPALAESIISSGQDFETVVSDTTLVAEAMDKAEDAMREVYVRREYDLPPDMGSAQSPGAFSRVIEVASEIVDVVNAVLDPTSDAPTSAEETVGELRAIESLVIKALQEQGVDSTIENASAFFTDQNNTTLVEALITGLESERADTYGMASNDFTGDDFDSVEDITDVAQLPSTAQAFSQIGGMSLRVQDLDLGTSPDKLDDSEIELYFHGATTDISGTFVACVKHIDDANIDGTLGEGSTRGEIVDGFWSLLGATDNSRESYSLLITITFLGSTYQAIMKPEGTETISDVEYERIRFDNDGEVRAWHSVFGLQSQTTIPTNNSECEERLPSRIGI